MPAGRQLQICLETSGAEQLEFHKISNLVPKRSQAEPKRGLRVKHLVLYVFYYAFFNFYTYKMLSTLFFDIFNHIF